jgi:flagella synthesis protein FlgN
LLIRNGRPDLANPGQHDDTLLLRAVNAEKEVVQSFVDLLGLEQAALAAGNTDQLPTLIEQKNLSANQLATLAQERNSILSAQGYAADRAGIEAWCEKHPRQTAVAEAWKKTISLASEARELNNINGKLITLRMQHNAKALEALRGGSNSLDLYGPDGQSTSLGRMRINDAV